jgi:hypothetical protein
MQGKMNACMNNYRHGMRSRIVLPWESQQDYDQQLAEAMADLKPQNATERRFVERYVAQDWVAQRGERVLNARAARQIHNVFNCADQRAADTAGELMTRLEQEPTLVR